MENLTTEDLVVEAGSDGELLPAAEDAEEIEPYAGATEVAPGIGEPA